MLRPTSWSEFDRFSPALVGERARATIEATGLGALVVYPVPSPEIDSALEKLRDGGWDGASGLVVLNPVEAFPAEPGHLNPTPVSPSCGALSRRLPPNSCCLGYQAYTQRPPSCGVASATG